MRVSTTDETVGKPASTLDERLASVATRRKSRLGRQFFAVAMAAAVICPVAFKYDDPIASFFRGWDLPGDLQKTIQLSEAFAHGSGVTFILLSVLVVATNRRRAVLVAILITALSGLIANGLKATVVRIRPHATGLQVKDVNDVGQENQSNGLASAGTNQVVEASFWDSRQRSFPSGHAATAWGLAIGLSLVFRRAWWIFAVLATLASLQRLESGAHYLSDVLAGGAIAFLVAAFLVSIPQLREQLELNKTTDHA